MTPQYENQVVSSFVLWLDNKIQTEGSAFTNHSSRFYFVTGLYNGYYNYGAPFKHFVYDASVPSANIITGVYLNNQLVGTGQSGFLGINYNEGQAIFSNQINSNVTVSGIYAIKDFHVKTTSRPEEALLFETHYTLNPKTNILATGAAANKVETYPLIYVRYNGGENEPWEMGGTENTYSYIRCIIIADSQFNLDAVMSIMKDTVRSYIPLLNYSEMPFNSIGSLKTGAFNYSQVSANKVSTNNAVFIDRVYTSQFAADVSYREYQGLNTNVFFGLCSFDLCKPRQVR